MDREWMYQRLDSSKRLRQSFIDGVYDFVSKAMNQEQYVLDGGLRCPCYKCICLKISKPSHVRAHLLQYGFQPNYTIWVNHGEDYPSHGFGRRSHMDIAMDLERKQGRPVESDELVMTTHRNKKGKWVDARAQQTYENYHERLWAMTEVSSQGSTSGPGQVDAATKLQAWKEVTGGKSKGRVYGTKDLTGNFRQGVSSLYGASSSTNSEDIEQLRKQVLEVCEMAKEATKVAKREEERAKVMKQRVAQMKESLRMVQQMLMMKQQRATTTFTSTNQVHPDYDEDRDPPSLP